MKDVRKPEQSHRRRGRGFCWFLVPLVLAVFLLFTGCSGQQETPLMEDEPSDIVNVEPSAPPAVDDLQTDDWDDILDDWDDWDDDWEAWAGDWEDYDTGQEGDDAFYSSEDLAQIGWDYYVEKYGDTVDASQVKAIVEFFGCHQEIHIYVDGQFTMALVYYFGEMYEIS